MCDDVHGANRHHRRAVRQQPFGETACQGRALGGHLDEQDDALARVLDLMRDLETLLISIKEAAIPVLVGTGEPTEAASRARDFLRLADRMLEDMNELLRTV
jgi:hypothetical protein